ncbi:hypothetical protein PFFCH_05763 [Plasmodium falciparum FCH/4]|uniref:Uncharacterized protein n=1 Tax=Plasmodium falciparum FCH/4 TaxID=1036724 RepID=A0A024VF47_PLAFA|nr:hypothetical protein PFFCH_05763 [Plasmodium falciparum FCH/4]
MVRSNPTSYDLHATCVQSTMCAPTFTTSNVHAILGTNFWVQRGPKHGYIKQYVFASLAECGTIYMTTIWVESCNPTGYIPPSGGTQ